MVLQVIWAPKVALGTQVVQVRVLKAGLEKLDFQVFLGLGAVRGPQVLLETLAPQGPMVKKV